MLKNLSREDKLDRVLSTIHVTLIIFAAIFAWFEGYMLIPFIYLVVFFINEYLYSQYRDGNKETKIKVAKKYMVSSASLIIWLIFLIYLPNIVSGAWSPDGTIFTILYMVFVMIAAAVMIAMNWIRKITTA